MTAPEQYYITKDASNIAAVGILFNTATKKNGSGRILDVPNSTNIE